MVAIRSTRKELLIITKNQLTVQITWRYDKRNRNATYHKRLIPKKPFKESLLA